MTRLGCSVLSLNRNDRVRVPINTHVPKPFASEQALSNRRAWNGRKKPIQAQGTRLDLMRLCPQPTAYEPGFTQTERPVVVAIAEIRRVYRVHQNPGGQAALVALSKGVMPPM